MFLHYSTGFPGITVFPSPDSNGVQCQDDSSFFQDFDDTGGRTDVDDSADYPGRTDVQSPKSNGVQGQDGLTYFQGNIGEQGNPGSTGGEKNYVVDSTGVKEITILGGSKSFFGGDYQ